MQQDVFVAIELVNPEFWYCNDAINATRALLKGFTC